MKLNRRSFIKHAGAVLGVFALRGVPAALAEEDNWTSIGGEADFPLDTPVFVKDYLVYVTRSEESVRVLSARCTHRGCTVDWSEDEFVCPCHQARFSKEGDVLKGPATDPLPEIPSKLDDGQVWLDL